MLLAPPLRLCQITFIQWDSKHTLLLSPMSWMVDDMFHSLTWQQESKVHTGDVHSLKALLKEKEHTYPHILISTESCKICWVSVNIYPSDLKIYSIFCLCHSSGSWMLEACVRLPTCWWGFMISAALELWTPTFPLKTQWKDWMQPPYRLEAPSHRLTTTGRTHEISLIHHKFSCNFY